METLAPQQGWEGLGAQVCVCMRVEVGFYPRGPVHECTLVHTGLNIFSHLFLTASHVISFTFPKPIPGSALKSRTIEILDVFL